MTAPTTTTARPCLVCGKALDATQKATCGLACRKVYLTRRFNTPAEKARFTEYGRRSIDAGQPKGAA